MWRIAMLPGDGIGPEVMRSAEAVLHAITARYGLQFNLQWGAVGGTAIEQHGVPLPPETLELAHSSDAILFGAVGGEQWDERPLTGRPEAAILGLRKELQLFANLRPSLTYSSLLHRSPLRVETLATGVDLLVVRELTGGLYFGEPKGQVTDSTGTRTVDTLVYTDAEIERVIDMAFRLARKRRRKLCSVDKANVLATGRRWREVATAFAHRYSDVEVEHLYVDNCAMQLVRAPGRFDVLVTENTFGDILTDLAAAIPGSIGMLPSASVGLSGRILYEPVHGSAPDIAGKGLANPIGMILCVGMMLEMTCQRPDAGQRVSEAVNAVLEEGGRTADLALPSEQILSTDQMTERICHAIVKGT